VDIKAYIESGIIESYVLGLAEPEEARLLEKYAQEYPEIQQVLIEFSDLLEKQSLQQAISPPAFIKSEIKRQIQSDFRSEANPESSLDQAHRPEADNQTYLLHKNWIWAAAVLFAASLGLNYFLYQKNLSLYSLNQSLSNDQQLWVSNTTLLSDQVADLQSNLKIISQPHIKTIQLESVEGKQNLSAIVYWDSKSKDVYLYPAQLDSISEEQEYQLWAIVDGVPVDAGIMGNCVGICKMNNIPKAQTFAITIEKKGGSKSPNLNALCVMGNV
jgi:anti-sigma-K factor RskA